MNIDKKNLIFKTIFTFVVLGMMAYAIFNFYNIASLKSDQNLYTNPPTKYYVTEEIPGHCPKTSEPDTARIGNLIWSINDSIPKSFNDFFRILESIPQEEYVNLKFIDNKSITLERLSPQKMLKREIMVKRKALPDIFIRYLHSAVLLIQIEQGGASERAGLFVGDFIVKINGEEFSSALEANEHIVHGESGSYLFYNILRDNEVFDANVEIVRYQIELNALLLFIAIIILLGLGLLIANKGKFSDVKNHLALSLVSIAFYHSFFLLPARQNGGMAYHDYFMFIFTSILVFIFVVNFVFKFPNQNKDLNKRKWIFRVPIYFGFLFVAATSLNLFVMKSQSLAITTNFYLQNALIVSLLYYFVLYIFFRKRFPKDELNIRRLINWNLFLIFAIAMISIFTNLFFKYSIGTYYVCSILLLPLSIIYTLGRYKLLGLDFNVRKNIQYILLSIVWKMILIGLIAVIVWKISELAIVFPNIHITGTNIEVLDKPLSIEDQTIYHNILIIAVSILGVLIFRYLHNWGKLKLNEKYYRTQFDYKKASIEFSSILEKNLLIDELANNIIDELSYLTHLKRIGIIVVNPKDKISLSKFHGINNDIMNEYCQLISNNILKKFSTYSTEISIHELDDSIKSIFQKCELKFLIPIKVKTRFLGVLLVGDKLSETPYTREELDFLNTIASQIAVSIDNAFLYNELASQERIKHELELARKIQLASLPVNIPDIKSLEVSGSSLPALEVGGDFYDFLNRNGDLTVIVGDVSGKGTSAALYMSKAQGIMRTLHEFDLSPKELHIKSNNLLVKYLSKSSFISSLIVNFKTDRKEFTVSRAGHLPLYYFSKSKNEIELIKQQGMVLGLTKGVTFANNVDEITLKYESGDVFVMISDGIIEARNPENMDFGQNMLLEVLKQNIHDKPEQIKTAVIHTVKEFQSSAKQYDDITIVVIKAK